VLSGIYCIVLDYLFCRMLCLFLQDEKATAKSVRARQLPSNEGIYSAVDPDPSVDQHVAGSAQHGWCS